MRKFVPFSPNEIDKTTQWLNDLAREGLCAETWGSFWVKFKEGESKDWVYQIDIDDSTGDPNYQRKLELEKQGWQYVQTIGNTRHHIYHTQNQGVSLVWNAEYIEKYQKTLRTNMFWEAVMGIIYVVLYLWLTVFRNGEYFLLSLVEASGVYEQILTFTIVCMVCDWIKDFVTMGKLRHQLMQGLLLTEHGNNCDKKDIFKKCKVPQGLRQILKSVLIAGLVILIFGIDDKGENFDDSQSALACVDLQDLEADGFEITSITWDDNPGVNFGNRILEKTGLFTEYFCGVSQYGTDANGEDVQISGHYYKLRPDGMTEGVLEQLIDRSISYMYEHQWLEEDKKLSEDYWTISEVENTGFEKVIVAEAANEDGPLMIFAQTEDIIIYLRYYGNLSAEAFVEELIRLYM